MGDDCINGTEIVDGVEFGLVINWPFIRPVDVGGKWGIWLLEMEVLGVHAVGTVNGCGSAYAEDSMSAGFHNRIVR